MSNNNSASGGIGFLGLLTVLLTVAFIVLKLCKAIDWSWIWVLSPIWIYLGAAILLLLIYAWAKARVDKNEKNRIESGYNKQAWDSGGKSKWQLRMEQMQEAQKKSAELKEKRGY